MPIISACFLGVFAHNYHVGFFVIFVITIDACVQFRWEWEGDGAFTALAQVGTVLPHK